MKWEQHTTQTHKRTAEIERTKSAEKKYSPWKKGPIKGALVYIPEEWKQKSRLLFQ